MHEELLSSTRRDLMAAGALGLVAIAGLLAQPKSAEAAEMVMTDAEKANLKLVGDFCQAWGEPTPDPAKLTSFMTADCVWTVGTALPPAAGKAAIAAQMKKFIGNGHFDLKILSSFARGSMVAHVRRDTQITPEKTGTADPIGGVFFIKGGKIAEWHELLFPKA